MIKRALITYAWDKERGETKWLFWLQKKLEAQGFEVSMSPLAQTNRTSDEVVSDLQTIYTIPNERVYFVNHDPGSLTILKYLEYLGASNKTETALLIAGLPKRNAQSQSSQNHYVRLEASGDVAVFNATPVVREQKLGEHLDIKLAVLYSADDEKLESGEKKRLSAPVAPSKNNIGDYFRGLWKKR